MSSHSLRVEPIGKHHRPILVDFKNQHEALANYPRRIAKRHLRHDLVGGTFLAILTDDQKHERVAGYFSMTTASLEREWSDGSGEFESFSMQPRFPIPCVLLTRFAVDVRLQGQGFGTYLMEEVFEHLIGALESNWLTSRVLLADAHDESAATFFEHFGFSRLTNEYPVTMGLDLQRVLSL